MLKTTAWYLDRFPFTLEVEGHTQKGAEITGAGPSKSWDLSTDRAVAARDVLQDAGLQPDRFWRVIGYADRIPLENTKPDAEENRRITIVARLQPDTAKNAHPGRRPMKTLTKPNLSTIFRRDTEQPVRLIKAAQAAKLLGGAHAAAPGAKAHAKPEIRLVKAGPDFCDLEIICGCGESQQVRCWNAPAAQVPQAVAA